MLSFVQTEMWILFSGCSHFVYFIIKPNARWELFSDWSL